MKSILHVIGSPRNERSVSKRIALTYMEEFQKNYPASSVASIDIWEENIPEFNEHALNAKYAGLMGIELTREQSDAWNSIKKIADHFFKADIIIFSVPMWNFGIPYKLKQLIDLISQKDMLFRFDENGFAGKLKNKKAVLVCSRGISYATGTDTPESEFDFQNSYMLMWLKFIGIENVTVIKAEQTLSGSGAEALQRGQKAAIDAVLNDQI